MAINEDNGSGFSKEQKVAQRGSMFSRGENEARDREDGARDEEKQPLFRRQGRVVPTTTGGETCGLINELFNSLAKAHPVNTCEWGSISLDQTQFPDLYYSVVLAFIKNIKSNEVYYFPMIIESSNTPYAEYRSGTGENTLVLTRVTSEAMNSNTISVCEDALARKYPQTKPIRVEGMVVPRSYLPSGSKATDTLVAEKVQQLASWVVEAMMTVQDSESEDFLEFSLDVLPSRCTIVANPSFGVSHQLDIVGQPNYSNLGLSMRYRTPVRQRESSGPSSIQGNGERADMEIIRVEGYTDAVYVGESEERGRYSRQEEKRDTRRLQPVYAITNILPSSSPTEEQPMTTPLVLMGLAFAAGMIRPDEVFRTFRDNVTPMNDIGAVLRYWDQELDAVDTSDPKFLNGPEFERFISKTFYADPIICLDVPAASPTTWYLDVFYRAVSDIRDEREAAEAYIIKAANQLTNGKFDDYYDSSRLSGDKHMFHYARTVQLGFYPHKSGQDHDLREYGLIAACNLMDRTEGEKVLGKFTRSMSDPNLHEVDRIALQQSICNIFTNHNARFTGLATRVIPDPEVLTALIKAINKSGVTFQRDRSSYDDSSTSYRGSADMGAYAYSGERISSRSGGYGRERDRDRDHRGYGRR